MASTATAAKLNAYTKVDVETASQGKLIVMLFNGAIKRAEEAKRQLERGRRDEVHNNLIRAQDILAELRGALNMKAGGEIAQNLDRIYEYFQHLLVVANVKKEVQPIDECIALMMQMRDTWQEVFDQLQREGLETPPPPPQHQHGAALLNLKG
jgi:flagellar protein FliS